MDIFNNDRYLLLPDGTVQVGSCLGKSFEPELDDAKTCLIADAHGPSEAIARTLPKRNIFKDFVKLPASRVVYMPVLSWDEIKGCHEKISPAITPERLSPLYDLAGRIPRFVLQGGAAFSAEGDVEKMLEQAISSCDV